MKNPRKKTSSVYVFIPALVAVGDTTTVQDPTTISTITTSHFALK